MTKKWAEPVRLGAVLNLVLSYIAILFGSYAFVLLWWSAEWQTVFACALAASTVLVIATPWGGPYDPSPDRKVDAVSSGITAVILYTFPVYAVSLLHSKAVAATALPIWVALAARRVHVGRNSKLPLVHTFRLVLAT